MTKSYVLVSWIAVNNDPFERTTRHGEDAQESDALIPGPTLTMLFDESSPYAERIKDVVILHRTPKNQDTSRSTRAVEETVEEIHRRDKGIKVHLETWEGDDPTDHKGIFEFLREKLPELRARFRGRELILHVSPGTASMHTVMVLLAETGFVGQPFTVVQSYKKRDRRGRPSVVPVEIGIDTYYKAYKTSHPSMVTTEEQTIQWDPALFLSERMQSLFAEARRFAQVKVPILILGERGTGKSMLANWIRLHSPYRKNELDAHWPAVACGQYSTETMRSELFGHVKGAYTGADKDKEGLLALADGDTLFLDELGDVSRDLQRMLIKAIEEKRFSPLGSDAIRQSDFRLISATNLDHRALDERLDPDFRDRVNALILELPALRDIPEELPWLWRSVYEEATRRAEVAPSRAKLTAKQREHVVRRLSRHPLPGNVRDLFKVAYRIITALADVHAPLSPADAVDYGLAALSGTPTRGEPLSRAIARAYVEAAPIDHLIQPGERLSTKTIFKELKGFLANEVKRISKDRAQKPEDLCDVKSRTIREWAQEVDSDNSPPQSGG